MKQYLLSLCPSASRGHIKWLTNTCNSSFRRSKDFLWPLQEPISTWHVCTLVHTHTHTCKNYILTGVKSLTKGIPMGRHMLSSENLTRVGDQAWYGPQQPVSTSCGWQLRTWGQYREMAGMQQGILGRDQGHGGPAEGVLKTLKGWMGWGHRGRLGG